MPERQTRISNLDYSSIEFPNDFELQTFSASLGSWEKYDNFSGFRYTGPGPGAVTDGTRASNNSQYNSIVWAPSSLNLSNNQWAQLNRQYTGPGSTTNRIGPAIQLHPDRAIAGTNVPCYFAGISDETVTLHFLDGTDKFVLVTASGLSHAATIPYRIELQGSIIQIFVDDILRITFDHGDSILQGGNVGIATINGNAVTATSHTYSAGDFELETDGPGVARRTLVDTSPAGGRSIITTSQPLTRVSYDRSTR